LPARVHILLGQPGCGKTARLVRHAKSAPSLWVLPTDRHGRDLCGREPSSRVTTLHALARRIALAGADVGLVPESHQRLLLVRVLHELRPRLKPLGPLVGGRGLEESAFSFISELKGLGISPDAFEAAATNVGIRPLDRDLALIFAAYQKLLDDHGWLDRDATYRLVVRRLGDTTAAVLPADTVVLLDGFVEFTPPQLLMLRGLAKRIAGLWFALPADAPGDETRAELFTVAANTAAELARLWPNAEFEHVSPADVNRPAGLTHLHGNLFRDDAEPASDAAGLHFIEAPAMLGEVRLVARAVKERLLAGCAPGRVLVSARDMTAYAGLIDEVFTGYGIPMELDRSPTLTDIAEVRTLLAAARLPEADWPFAATAALLRNTLINLPGAPAQRRLDAELLLRSLGVPAGRDAYLAAAGQRADAPEPALDDEEAEGSRRRRRHELARRAEPVLRQFFDAWGQLPGRVSLDKHVAWLGGLAINLGIGGAADDALQPFWDELAEWSTRDSGRPIDFTEFLELIDSLAASTGRHSADAEAGGVRVVPAELAADLDCDHLYLLGLGERGFPRARGGGGLYDEDRRRAFRATGVDLAVVSDALPFEMLLFFRLMCAAARSATLSYPAVDEAGQDLLPGAFWRCVKSLFHDVPTTRRQMLLEGLDSDPPLSPAEYRVRFAAAGGDASGLTPDLKAHLSAARAVWAGRFEERTHGPFDGLLTDPDVKQDVARRFGPDAVFSPTSLEAYVACPFKFFLGRVLNLTRPDEPVEEIEHHRRGAAYHRALRRTHDEALHDPSRSDGERLAGHLMTAAAEYADRVASPFLKTLWRLEGERLGRTARRYDEQVKKYSEPRGCRTHGLEIDGSVVATHDGVSIRLVGRIDRIDVRELDDGTLGFWVIDYKTGRGAGYSVKAMTSLALVQLPVYALAAEQIVGGRPLGMLYWMPAGKTAFCAHPKKPLDWLDQDGWPAFRARVLRWLAEIAGRIRAGEFPLQPRSDDCTATCEFSQACRITQSRRVEKDWELPLPIDTAEAD
jgi:ATP-dependent helicase/DNAse subunit B